MAAKFFATRSAIETPNDDFTAAMQASQLGPFATAKEARDALTVKLMAAHMTALTEEGRSLRGYIPQYQGLLTAIFADATATLFQADGVQWEIRSV